MSRHFLYEVDENSLRSKLSEGSQALNEEAWQKFELYLTSQKENPATKAWLSLSFNFNKAYILPGVFAAMILLFSLLLYNFISIRLPDKTSLKKKQSVLSPKVLQTNVLHPIKITTKPASSPKIEATENRLTAPLVQIKEENVSEKVVQMDPDTQKGITHSVTPKHERIAKKTVQVKKDTIVVAEILPDIKPVYDNNEAELPPLENVPD